MQKKLKNEVVAKHKAAFGLNIAIIVFIFLGFTFLFAKLHPTGVFPHYGAINLRLYSTLVNILAGGSAIMMVVLFSSKEKREKAVLPRWAYLINFVITSSLFFNMLMQLTYLLPVCTVYGSYNVEWLFTGTNMIFYMIVPLLAMAQFIFALPKANLKFKDCFYCLIPVGAYFVFYTIYALSALQADGSVLASHDWYGFCHYSTWFIILAVVGSLGIVYGLSVLTWYANKASRVNQITIDLILNVIILFMCIVGTVWLFYNAVADETSMSAKLAYAAKRFYYFTNWSSFMLLITCTINIVFLTMIMVGVRKKLPLWVELIHFAAIVLTAIVLFFELCVIAPINFFKSGIDLAWKKSFRHHLMFSHLLIPLLSIFTYIVVEHKNIRRRWCLATAAPLGIYCLIYMTVLYCHYEDKWVSGVWWDVYDILGFLNYKLIWLVPIVLYGLSLLISWLIWLANRRVHIAITQKEIVAK